MDNYERLMSIAKEAYEAGQKWSNNLSPKQKVSIFQEGHHRYPSDTFGLSFFIAGAEDFLYNKTTH